MTYWLSRPLPPAIDGFAADWDSLQEIAGNVGAARRRLGVDDVRGANYLNAFRQAADLHLQRQTNGLAEAQSNVPLFDRLETL